MLNKYTPIAEFRCAFVYYAVQSSYFYGIPWLEMNNIFTKLKTIYINIFIYIYISIFYFVAQFVGLSFSRS